MAGRNEQESGLLGCISLKHISLAPLKPRLSFWFYPSVQFWPQISELMGICNFHLVQIGLKMFSKISLKSRL